MAKAIFKHKFVFSKKADQITILQTAIISQSAADFPRRVAV